MRTIIQTYKKGEMQMAYIGSSGNDTVDAMGQFAFTGNVIPMNWYHTICRDNGKPHLLAITILSDIVYWYRPTEVRDERTGQIVGWRKKFSGNLLQKSYAQYESLFGESKRSVKAAIDLLIELGVVYRHFKDIKLTPNGPVEIDKKTEDGSDGNEQRLYNVMFLDINIRRLVELTYPEENEQKCEEPSNNAGSGTLVQNNVGGGTKFCRGAYNKMQEGVQSFVGGGTTDCSTLVQNNVIGGTEFCGTNTKNTSENIITESTSSLVWSDKDATGQDQCIEENPIIVLDITKQIDEADIWNMQGLLKEKNGISFGWYNNVDMMTKAIQVLANWNGVAMKSEKKHDNAEWVSIYVCMVKNLIEMCLARKPIKFADGRVISYSKVIEQINVIYHKSEYKYFALDLFLDRCIQRYIDATMETKIHKIDSYCKSLLWNALTTYELDWHGYFNRTYFGGLPD